MRLVSTKEAKEYFYITGATLILVIEMSVLLFCFNAILIWRKIKIIHFGIAFTMLLIPSLIELSL